MDKQARGELEEYVDMQEGARADDCVSKKISHLMHTGKYSQDQAIAIAYSMCEGRDLPEWVTAEQRAEIDGLFAEEDRACKPKKDEDTPRSIPSANTVQSGQVTLRFVDRAVTALDTIQGICRGYVAIWGDPEHRDAFQTYFDASRPPEMGIDNGMHRRPILYEHSQDGAIRMEIVGTITRIWRDDIGIAYEGELDRSSEFFPRIVEELQRGELKTSSATMEHTAEFYEDGAFRTWILGELSLTKTPAESRMPNSTLIRSQAHEGLHDATRAGDEPTVSIEIEIQPEHESQSQGEKEMTPEQLAMLQQLVAEFGVEAVMAALQQAQQQQPAPAPAEAMSATPQAPADMRSLIDAVRATLTATQQNAEVVALRSRIAALEAANNAPPVQATETTRGARQVGAGVNVNMIPDRKTGNLSASDMWFVQQALGANGKGVSEAFTRSMVAKSVDAFQPAAKAGDEFAQSFVRSFGTKRADEIMATNIAGQGTEWVGVAYATDLWEKIRVAPIFDAFRSLGMMEMELGQGQNSIYVPTEGADPTWYSAPEANDTSSGRIEVTSNPQFVGTGRALVTPGTLKATVAWSEELDEDSLIPMASWLNTQMARSAAEVAEYVLINGDTTITLNNNLNLYDGTPGTGASRPAYLATNGILKLPIITTTSLSYDANNTHTEDTYLSVLKKLPDNVNGDVNNVVFIIGVQEHFAAINIPAFKTRDVNSQATVENGVLTRVYGRKVLMSGQMGLAYSTGKISATAGNNTYGRIIAAVPRYWAVVNKRDVRFKLSEDPYNDAQLLRVSFRMGATYRSATSAAAAAFEVAV